MQLSIWGTWRGPRDRKFFDFHYHIIGFFGVQPNIIKVYYALDESEFFFAHTLPPPATINSNGRRHLNYIPPIDLWHHRRAEPIVMQSNDVANDRD